MNSRPVAKRVEAIGPNNRTAQSFPEASTGCFLSALPSDAGDYKRKKKKKRSALEMSATAATDYFQQSYKASESNYT